MTTIKEIQELATQTDDWTKREVARNLLKAIEQWQIDSAGLDRAYRDLHEALTLLAKYPEYPDDIPRSVSHFSAIIGWSIDPMLERMGEYSEDAKAHANRIDEYLTFLSIYGDDEDQLWKEIAQKEDN